MDKKAVYLVSNFHNSEEIGTVSRRNKDGTSQQVGCPKIVIDYNNERLWLIHFTVISSIWSLTRWYNIRKCSGSGVQVVEIL
ncbi:hypothetical protein NQ318_023606 [Aromia moschata]|uniref:Uncharacterized protein n=1 Tax=Aromia moschata TaxID=1265417 RepID=A0AAV8YNY6_9CUCU|nr:hypothetical protein NQ318_023606 [Aromia moschata]